MAFLFATISGWRTLAGAYRFDGEFDGERWGSKSARIGSVNYNRCLTFGSATDGLHIKPSWFFRLAHPPLFIPWSDVAAEQDKGWIFRYLDFRFAQAPEIRVRVSERLGTSLLSAAGRSLREMVKVSPDAVRRARALPEQ
jgi:hypothetical protein